MRIVISSWDAVAQIVKLTTAAVRGLIPRREVSVGASSETPGHPVADLLDGDYHSYFQAAEGPWPKCVTMSMTTSCEVIGLCLTQPETGPVRSGGYAAPTSERIREYAVHVSPDGKQWGEPVKGGELSNRRGLQVIRPHAGGPRTSHGPRQLRRYQRFEADRSGSYGFRPLIALTEHRPGARRFFTRDLD